MRSMNTLSKIMSPQLDTERKRLQLPKILIIQNCAVETLGLYENYLIDNNIEYDVFHAYEIKSDQNFPSVKDYNAFIIGPTPISANEIHEHEFLMKEWDYIDEIVRYKKPCIGVCCGAQLLAKYLGAEVKKNPVREIGIYEVRLTEYGRIDPIFEGFPETFPVFHWHGDTFDIPSGAMLLVEGDDCKNQAFGYKNIIGLQFHLETTAVDVERWTDTYPNELKEVHKTKEQAVAECKEKEPKMKKLCYRLMDNFLGLY